MIELKHDSLNFSFLDVHPDAKLSIVFQRTLRIPDDDATYPLPPGLGCFPLRHVDDFATAVPAKWLERGGVMMPMYQSEALWISFLTSYPFAVKVAAGKINAVSGEPWQTGLHRDPQDYVVAPEQPWLDGFCVRKGVIRQFVAMPLGAGYSVEEQLTGAAEHGGLQLQVYPLRPEVYEKSPRPVLKEHLLACMSASMGLAPGGQMRQEIYADRMRLEDWSHEASSRCFVHLANSLVWRQLTGENPPTSPFTAKEYEQEGLPWFDYYGGDAPALAGGAAFAKIKSVAELGNARNEKPLPENESLTPQNVIQLRKNLLPDEVRVGPSSDEV